MTARRLLVCAVALLLCALALLLFSCGAESPPSADRTPPVSAQHVDADVAFARAMIPHHAEGVEMARLAADRAGSEDVTQLAGRIEQTQEAEIAELYGLLHAWGAADTAAPDSGEMNSMGTEGPSMPGAVDGPQMQQLEELRGAAFDRQFLTLMIAHHQGAVQMATTELADGVNPEAKVLAGRMLDAQQAEIGEMRGMPAAR